MHRSHLACAFRHLLIGAAFVMLMSVTPTGAPAMEFVLAGRTY